MLRPSCSNMRVHAHRHYVVTRPTPAALFLSLNINVVCLGVAERVKNL